jgi:TolB-like protein
MKRLWVTLLLFIGCYTVLGRYDFEGELNNSGQPHGYGKKIYHDDGLIDEGEFVNGMRVGFHRITKPDGTSAMMLFNSDEPIKGYGIWVYPDGTKKVGELIDTPNNHMNLRYMIIDVDGKRTSGIWGEQKYPDTIWSEEKLFSYLKDIYPDFIEFDNYQPSDITYNEKIYIPAIPPPPDVPTFIAVINLIGNNISDSEAKAFSDRLRIELYNTKHFSVVERGMMEEILAEQGLQQSGCTTNECIVEVGQLIGVKQIIGGSISKVGNTYSISTRIVNVETGNILHTTTYDYNGEIDELLTSGMKKVAIELIK